ncbi:hypothetical protein KC19_5G176100 [Ceratodon purpureus]|uniref:Uncharacterized protein n=1 Tax=Ceratodon purpureus TaxID=3225 RepID=A0A8T0I3P7_CERPU|nr:hypothetical protein KC19_5G176100 [Ceratodon purpureus]
MNYPLHLREKRCGGRERSPGHEYSLNLKTGLLNVANIHFPQGASSSLGMGELELNAYMEVVR